LRQRPPFAKENDYGKRNLNIFRGRDKQDCRGDAIMAPMDLTWQEYEQQRRRLNARLGLVVLALLPLPAILIAVGV